MTASQEFLNPASSVHCCFSSGKEFSKKKQIEVGQAIQSSSEQNKNMKLWDVPEVTPFVTNLSWRGQFSLGMAETGNLKLALSAQ